jgi:hypothetical protein
MEREKTDPSLEKASLFFHGKVATKAKETLEVKLPISIKTSGFPGKEEYRKEVYLWSQKSENKPTDERELSD